MDKPAAQIEGVSVWQFGNYTGPSFNLIKRNVPQSNITWPNNSKVVTVAVFGNWYEETNITVFVTFLPEKQHLSPTKNFNSPSVCVEK